MTETGISKASGWVALLAPIGVVGYVAFSAGGFFAGATAVAAAVLVAVLGFRILTGDHPTAGISVGLAIASASLAGLAIWVLISHLWSDSAARGLLEFDRVLLYLAVALLTGLLVRSRRRMQALVWAAGLVVVVVVGAGLLTRILPEVFPTDPAEIGVDRLSHPLTYWNGLGILAGFGVILGLAVASDDRQPPFVRPVGAALVVPMAAGLFFTFSRGAIAATILGLLTFIAVARPRALPSALLAVAPATAVVLIACYEADALASSTFDSREGIDQGHTVALVLLLATAGAALVRTLGLRLDRRLEDFRLSEGTRRNLLAGTAAAVLLGSIAAAALTDAPEAVGRQVDRFMEGRVADDPEDARARLTEVGNNRGDNWQVAADAWTDRPLVGQGAGTYPLLWDRERPDTAEANDAHSLYLETLTELGLVGLVLLGLVVGALLVGGLRRCREADRVLYGGVLAVIFAWAVHAGIDWDWELPAVTMIPFALGGAALATSTPRIGPPARLTRLAIGIGLLVLAITPVSIALSQFRLDASVEAFRKGDCMSSIDKALGSIDALSIRPEPFELLTYCNIQSGEFDLAERSARRAIRRDPRNWEFRYDLALAMAAAGRDAQAAIRQARRLNPREPLVRDLQRMLSTDDSLRWRAVARTAPVLIR